MNIYIYKHINIIDIIMNRIDIYTNTSIIIKIIIINSIVRQFIKYNDNYLANY
jgi:hypothetical protein